MITFEEVKRNVEAYPNENVMFNVYEDDGEIHINLTYGRTYPVPDGISGHIIKMLNRLVAEKQIDTSCNMVIALNLGVKMEGGNHALYLEVGICTERDDQYEAYEEIDRRKAEYHIYKAYLESELLAFIFRNGDYDER